MPEGFSAAVAVGETGAAVRDSGRRPRVVPAPDENQEQPVPPVMPTPPFPTFQSMPTLSQQSPGHGFQSGRDSRAR